MDTFSPTSAFVRVDLPALASPAMQIKPLLKSSYIIVVPLLLSSLSMEYSNLPIVIPSVSVGIKAKPHFATLDCHVVTSLLLAMTSGKFEYSATAHKVCNFTCAMRKFHCDNRHNLTHALRAFHCIADAKHQRCNPAFSIIAFWCAIITFSSSGSMWSNPSMCKNP